MSQVTTRIRGALVVLRTNESGEPVQPVVNAGTVRREYRMERKLRQMRQGSHLRRIARRVNVQVEIPAPTSAPRKLW